MAELEKAGLSIHSDDEMNLDAAVTDENIQVAPQQSVHVSLNHISLLPLTVSKSKGSG